MKQIKLKLISLLGLILLHLERITAGAMETKEPALKESRCRFDMIKKYMMLMILSSIKLILTGKSCVLSRPRCRDGLRYY